METITYRPFKRRHRRNRKDDSYKSGCTLECCTGQSETDSAHLASKCDKCDSLEECTLEHRELLVATCMEKPADYEAAMNMDLAGDERTRNIHVLENDYKTKNNLALENGRSNKITNTQDLENVSKTTNIQDLGNDDKTTKNMNLAGDDNTTNVQDLENYDRTTNNMDLAGDNKTTNILDLAKDIKTTNNLNQENDQSNSTALRLAKTQMSFGHAECSRNEEKSDYNHSENKSSDKSDQRIDEEVPPSKDETIETIPEHVIRTYKLSAEEIKKLPRFENYEPGEPNNVSWHLFMH